MAITPTVDQVGGLLRTRTKATASDSEAEPPYVKGQELGTFTEHTRPTDTQVEVLIAQAVTVVAGRIGVDRIEEGGDFEASAQHCAALYTALLIEQGYFSEQLESGQSPWDRLKILWDEEIEQLTDALSGGSQSRGLVTCQFVTPFSEDDTADELELPLP